MANENTVKRAAAINAAGKYSKVILALLVNAILARILTPDDYGVVAIVTVFSTFFSTLSDMGFGVAIIQNKTLSEDDINNVYTITVYIGIVFSILFAILSFPLSWIYDNKDYVELGIILSGSLFFNTLNMIPNGILNRDKEFGKIAFRTVIVYALSSFVAIILAFMGMRYYAIAFQSTSAAAIMFFWNFKTTKPKFKRSIDFLSIKKIANYSAFQFAFNITNYFSRNLDNLLTGKFIGVAQLGFYNKAYTLMLYPVNNLSGVISPVLHPILSDYQKELDVIYKKYLKVLRILLYVGAYVAPVCFLCSKEIIRLMYGEGWEGSVQCFQILSLAIIPQLANSSAGAIFQACNSTNTLFYSSCINTVVTVTGICIGIFVGNDIVILSVCVMIAYWIQFFVAFFLLIRKTMGRRFGTFIVDLKKEVILSVLMIGCSLLFMFFLKGFHTEINYMVWLFTKVGYLTIAFIAGTFLTGEWSILSNMFMRKGKN